MATKAPSPDAARAQRRTRKARPSTPIFAAAAVFAGVVAGFISMFFLADSLAALGIPDPGRVTTFGLPFVRGVAWLLMALSVGSFMASAFLIAPRIPGGENARLHEAMLSVDGHVAARTGAWSAFGVAVAALLEVPLVMSDLTGTPVIGVLDSATMHIAITQIATAQVWLVTAGFSALLAVGGLVARSWAAQPLLFAASLLQIVPLGLEGHSASGGDHDYGTNSLLWHLFFIMLWVGGLMGLIAHARRLGPGLPRAVRCYSTLAFAAIVALAISGVVNAFIRIEPADLLHTRYGLIIVAKAILTVVLGLCGLIHRQATMPYLESRPRLFVRVAVVELFIMAATIGVAITMGRTPPPPPRNPNLNAMQILMGYELTSAPTFGGVWTMFRFDIMFGTIGLILAALYAYALLRLRRRGLAWPIGRTAWFMAGAFTLVIVMSSGIGMYVPAVYSMHMLVHMILSMVIPLFMVLGAPVTLVLEAFEPGPSGQPSLHDYAAALQHSRILRFITHPLVNVLQFLFFFYVIYLFADLYQFAISEHAGHLIMNFCFLASGYVYFWEVIGPDRLPARAPTNVRLGILFFSMPLHLFAGVYLMQLQTVLGLEFYQSLGLPWDPDFLQDQRVGGGIAWGFGQFPLVIVFGALFLEWLRDDRAAASRHDRKADVDGDADLARYNEMLARLGEGDEESFRAR